MFVSLHNHTEWSILDSIVKVNELFERAKELNQSSIAITDHGTFLAMWDALKVSKKTKVKLIVGCEFYFTPDPSQTEEHFKHIILLAKNQIGYKNLLALHYKGFSNIEQKFKKSYSVIDWKLLEEHSEGVICLTSCGNGILAKSILDKNIDEAISIAQRLKDIFKEDLGLEVQANNLKRPATFYNQKIDQNYLNRQIINIGKKLDIKVVPTCNTHYLKKEDHETHDVLLAIGCHQPVYSNFRLKYDVPDFYLKSEEEIKAFFSRNYGEEYAEEIIKNTEYFANKCENPVWIDPKFTNPSGKELPEIDPRTEPDYNEFLSWVDGKEDIKKKKLDHQYLRYKCDIGFQKHLKTIPEEQHKIYLDRIEEEFDVLEYKDFCSYMLIVSDFLNWCRDNNIPVGTGRGCLTKDTQVLTEGGFITLDKINIGDKVYTHTGELKNVFNTFKYDINETGLEIKTNYSFKPISLTKDHKVYGVKNTNKRYPIDMSDCVPQWLEAKDLEVNDFIFMPWILDRKISIYHDVIINDKPCFDISRFIDSNSIIEEDSIVVSLPKNNDLSIRAIHKGTNICRGLISQIKAKKVKPSNYILERLSNYLESNSCDFESWLNDKNHVNHKVKRFIECNKDLYYFLGRWVGDGWSLKSKSNSYITGIAFHSDDQVGIDKIISYIKELGYTPSVYKSKTKKLTQVIFSSKMFYNFMRYLFPDYKDSSNTKHFPIHFRNLNDEFLKELILGYSHSDGSVEKMDSTKTRDNFDSTSLRLILELKEALLYLKIPSGISTRKPYISRGYLCKESYKLKCYGINSNIPERFVITDSGYYCRVTSIEEVELKEVYDISVEEDTSYLTSNYAVHNSVGGSIIAYYIGIHQADPIKYDLIFARFQNKEKEAYPDIDNDIAPSGRQHLLKYLTIKYGADKVAHVSNYNRITPKIYVKDVCRALELGGSKDAAVELGNKIADSISNDSKSVLQTLKESPLFEEYTKQYPEILKHLKLDGIIRSAATHAGGVIISKRSLPEIVSVRKDIDGTMSVEYEKERAEENGLVKIDILGLSTLDTIALTNKIALQQNKTIKAPDYNEYDPEAYKLLSSGDTFCVFQLGTSGGTIDLCKKVKPTSIEDISNINSLARPSAKDIRDKFIKTKEGKLPVNILHSSLQRAFGKTLGFGLYEECLMYLGQDVAGWSLNSTDRLRKMTKDKGKNPEKVKKLKEEFIKDSINNGILEKDATTIWTDVIELFQGYGFNRSHSTLYSMISYHTAWLKAHYPVEFLLANLISELDSNAPNRDDNIAKIKHELRSKKITILKPDLNDSQMSYSIVDDKTLLTGFDGLKNVGDDAIKDIILKRPFKDFFDFMNRTDSKKVRSSAIQALISVGCLDSFGLKRKTMFLYCQDYRKKLQVWSKKHNPETEIFTYPFPEESEWSISELFALETKYMGEAFICKPADAYKNFFNERTATIADVRACANKTIIKSMKGIVRAVIPLTIKKENSKYFGQEMYKVIIEDKLGDRCVATIFPDRVDRLNKRLAELHRGLKFDVNLAIHFSGTVNIYEDEAGIIFDELYGASLPPAVPVDLKPRKVLMRSAAGRKSSKQQNLLEEIEDSLIEDGYLDSNEDDE